MHISENGDIRLHGQEGLLLVFNFTDEDDNPRDMTTAIVTFRTEIFEKALVTGDTPDQLLLVIEEGELPPAMLNKKVQYIILDESGSIPHVILEANMVVAGWL